MEHLDGRAAAVVTAAAATRFSVLVAVERYPEWGGEFIGAVTLLDREHDGLPVRARLVVHVAQNPFGKRFEFDTAILRRGAIDTEEAEGVLFAQGSRFGGHALYIKDRKLRYAYNWVGLFEQIVESTIDVPTGHVVLSASFEREGDAMPTEGTLTLHIRDEAVGEARIKTQPGKFSLAGEGLNTGREGAEPVTDDYPGDRPWAFVGGTIHKALIDVSGKPFVDLANEVRMAFPRD
jgi:hypothetical protein